MSVSCHQRATSSGEENRSYLLPRTTTSVLTRSSASTPLRNGKSIPGVWTCLLSPSFCSSTMITSLVHADLVTSKTNSMYSQKLYNSNGILTSIFFYDMVYIHLKINID